MSISSLLVITLVLDLFMARPTTLVTSVSCCSLLALSAIRTKSSVYLKLLTINIYVKVVPFKIPEYTFGDRGSPCLSPLPNGIIWPK